MGMEFTVTFRGDHVHVHLSGESTVDPDLPKDYWGMLRELYDEYDRRRVLVERMAPSTDLGPADVVDASQRFHEIGSLFKKCINI